VQDKTLNESEVHLYLTAFYWSLTTLTTVGYGDISPKTDEEVLLCVIWMFFGVGFYSFIISSLTSAFTSYNARQQTLEKLYKQIDLYSAEKLLPENTVKEVKQSVFHNVESITLGVDEQESFFDSIPKKLTF
jgi:voltage-gated potassium channel